LKGVNCFDSNSKFESVRHLALNISPNLALNLARALARNNTSSKSTKKATRKDNTLLDLELLIFALDICHKHFLRLKRLYIVDKWYTKILYAVSNSLWQISSFCA